MSRPKLDKMFVFHNGITRAKLSLSNPFIHEVDACCSKKVSDIVFGVMAVTNQNDEFHREAVAKPDKYDKFSEKVGADIAGMKVDRKYHAYIVKRALNIIDALQDVIDEMYYVAGYHQEKVDKIDDDIKRNYL